MQEADTRSNTEVLSNITRMVVDADMVGSQTLVKLQLQREQLLNMDDTIFDINVSLGKAETSLGNMKKGLIMGFFPSKGTKEQRKGLASEHAVVTKPAGDASMGRYGVIAMPAHVNRAYDCARLCLAEVIRKKGKVKIAPAEKLMFHYCNSSKASFMIRDVTSRCVLLTKARLLRIEDDQLVSEVYFSDVKSVEHLPSKPLRFDTLRFALKGDANDTGGKGGGGMTVDVEVWGSEVAEFFLKMVERVVEDLPRLLLEGGTKKEDRRGRDKVQKKGAILPSHCCHLLLRF